MKLYVAVCSLCLLTGAALGHFNGKYAAAATFVDDCDSLSIVVFHDRQNETNRHFHCFEIETPALMKMPVKREPPLQPVI